jgi:hypothetical protein
MDVNPDIFHPDSPSQGGLCKYTPDYFVSNGIQFRFLNNLHAKLLLFDKF